MKENREISIGFVDLMEEYRIKKGISSNKLAGAVGISAAYLCRIKNGKRKAPSVPIAMSIARELNIPREVLMPALGLNVEAKDIYVLLAESEFTIEGKLAGVKAKKEIADILRSNLLPRLRGNVQ